VRDSNPVWSPDGRRIAFESNWQLWVMNADGSGQLRLTRTRTRNLAPSWSPDGRKIAFESKRDGQAEIYVMNPDGSGQRNLTRTRGWQERWSAWSPAQK
jgi:TolB protein